MADGNSNYQIHGVCVANKVKKRKQQSTEIPGQCGLCDQTRRGAMNRGLPTHISRITICSSFFLSFQHASLDYSPVHACFYRMMLFGQADLSY